MTFVQADLTLVVGSNGFNLWRYKSADAAATIDTSGYFNAAKDVMNVGDWIIALANGVSGVFVVSSNNGTVVNVKDLQVNATVDTD